jgi:hypothetical protein
MVIIMHWQLRNNNQDKTSFLEPLNKLSSLMNHL